MSTIALAITAVSTVFLAGAAAADTPAAELTNDPSGIAVVEFLDLALNQKQVDAAIDKYLAPPYTQHNPMVPDGIEGARVGLGGLVKQLPGFHYDIKRVFVDGDFVIVHSHATTTPEDRGMAIVDIFRMDDDKIVEHWDVIQPIPEKAANENTMF